MKPLPEKEEQYSYLQEDQNYKIGMFWNSGSGFEQAHFRSIQPEPLFDILNRDFTDTFSLVSQMDLVITSCTSIAHIAAAQGKEVCVFVPIMEYLSLIHI